jgi:hypothetical protein
MSFPQSAEYQLEQAIAPLFASVAGLNVYTTNRTGSRLFPYVSISATPVRQLIGPYSGVYEMNVAVNYSQTSAKYSETQFDEQYLDIFGVLYSVPIELNIKIQDNTTDLKVYMARISSQTPTININKRAWQRGLVINAIVTPDEFADGLYDYEFDEASNSFYLATI